MLWDVGDALEVEAEVESGTCNFNDTCLRSKSRIGIPLRRLDLPDCGGKKASCYVSPKQMPTTRVPA
jgi:hypothetical protein